MTSNIHTSYSAKLKGAGIAIGTCYADYYELFTKEDNNAQISYDKSQKFAKWGFVDETTNLKDQPVFVLSGGKDSVVPPIKQTSIKDYYDLHGGNPTVHTIADMGHTYPSIFWASW